MVCLLLFSYIICTDLQGRLSILKICTEKIPLDTDVSLDDVAVLTDLFSGADIENLCKEVRNIHGYSVK